MIEAQEDGLTAKVAGLTAGQVNGLLFVDEMQLQGLQDVHTVKDEEGQYFVTIVAEGEVTPCPHKHGHSGIVPLHWAEDGTLHFPGTPQQPTGPNGELRSPLQMQPEKVLTYEVMEMLKGRHPDHYVDMTRAEQGRYLERRFQRIFQEMVAQYPDFDPELVSNVRQKLNFAIMTRFSSGCIT